MPAEAKPKIPVPAGYVRLTCDAPWLNLTCLIGPESPRIVSGTMGWEIEDHPKQVGMTVWRGVEPLQGELSLMLDGFRTGPDGSQRLADRFLDPQTPNIANLWAVARGDVNVQPGLLAIEGIPEFPNIDWVIESMEIGDSIRSDTNFKVARSLITMTVREYNPPRYVSPRSPTGSPKGKTVTWTVKKNDTPTSIAMKIGCQWTDIRELNKKVVKAAKQNLRDGSKIRVPATKNAQKMKGKSRAKH
jgi:hypothetical protein